jgi:hypothetical protein
MPAQLPSLSSAATVTKSVACNGTPVPQPQQDEVIAELQAVLLGRVAELSSLVAAVPLSGLGPAGAAGVERLEQLLRVTGSTLSVLQQAQQLTAAGQQRL